jgi:hypothetical protein
LKEGGCSPTLGKGLLWRCWCGVPGKEECTLQTALESRNPAPDMWLAHHSPLDIQAAP